MKYYIPALCLVFLSLGIFLGSYYTKSELGSLFEQSVVSEAAMETRLHTVALARLRKGETEQVIKTLEGSLSIQEVLLETCQQPLCKVALSQEVSEAKELIKNYRATYPIAENK